MFGQSIILHICYERVVFPSHFLFSYLGSSSVVVMALFICLSLAKYKTRRETHIRHSQPLLAQVLSANL